MELNKAQQISKSRELGLLLNSSLLQRRILYSCLAVMNPIIPHLKGLPYKDVREWLDNNNTRSLRTYYINLNDFSATWNIGGKSLPDKINASIGYDPKTGSSPDIMRLCFKHMTKDGVIRFINVISSVEIDKSGLISITLTDDILPYLINLTSYTAIPFKATVRFKSQYSFTVLEYLLRRYVRNSKYPDHDLSLETLHIVLGTTQIKTYESWTRFKQKVLDRIEQDFSNVAGGGYDLKFEPVYSKAVGRGRPKVESVQIQFNDIGFKKFLTTKKEQRQGLNSTKNASSEAQQALKHYELEQQKQRDIKTSQEEFGF